MTMTALEATRAARQTEDREAKPPQVETRRKNLLTTDEAAAATGLTAYELRLGFKAGKYPALRIGRGGCQPRLRWRLDLLEAAIEKAMLEQEKADEKAILADWSTRRRAAGRAGL